jgi:hypothetical protein
VRVKERERERKRGHAWASRQVRERGFTVYGLGESERERGEGREDTRGQRGKCVRQVREAETERK